MTNLPQVTIICITTRDHGPSIAAIKKTLEQIKPHEVLFFSNIYYDDPDFKCIPIEQLTWDQYNEFLIKEAWQYVDTEKCSHMLVIQYDGMVIDGSAWDDRFLHYDYIGAPWTYKDGRNVGNGGFSLRSITLHTTMSTDPFIDVFSPEDEVIGRLYRNYLEKHHNIKFAPEELAHKFSFEMHPPKQKTFGFHQYFHKPWREPIILKRTGAMGDIIIMEPLMAYFYNKGRRVILNCLPHYFNLFQNHPYPVEHVAFLKEDFSTWETINLDMAYENKPQQLALKSYFETAGVTDYTLRNPKLNFAHDQKLRLFTDPYIILHIDDTAMAHRNIHGVDWKEVVGWIELYTKYKVFQIGQCNNGKAALHINSTTENLLGFVMADASYFIGIDSGPSQVAMACGIESVVFFGSVYSVYRYHDDSIDNKKQLHWLSKLCPLMKDGCYHSVISETGIDCEINIKQPPCITWTTEEVIGELKRIIK